ncbi:MAG: NupC/NupG family nucleoside CNT transporter [Planctomycetes bacterium]|nr:NupC/NupG family nucleoside CNT transporter [Planctomycetota bacterium]
MPYARALIGVIGFCLIAWCLSSDRRRFPWRTVLVGISGQVLIALFILRTSAGRAFFEGVGAFFQRLVGMTEEGTKVVFGSLGASDGPAGFVFAFAGTGLVVIVFFSALMAVLYHLGLMQVLVWLLAKVMSRTMGLSGGEAMASAANIFMGQTEAPLVVRPYLARMTRSELNALMIGGFATIAGSVMAIYMAQLGELGAHLVTASVMSAPASFVIAKILMPETEVSETAGRVELEVKRSAANTIEAATNGTLDGLKLWWNVIAMLIAFIALVKLVDWPLGWVGTQLAAIGLLDVPADGVALSLGRIFGWIFSPVAWLIGVSNWSDCQTFGGLLGTMVSQNEFLGFLALKRCIAENAFQDPRSAAMAAYALCGFANFASIGIQIGGISALVPERKTELSRLGLRAMIGGAMSCWMTATIAGCFLEA